MFRRGDTVVVECDAYLGDPAYELLWIRNETLISPDSSNQKTLTITNIGHEHAGIYQCGFNVLGRDDIISIIVNVQERDEEEDTIVCSTPSPNILFSYADRQPLNLTCDCRTDQSDTSLEFRWNIHNLRIVQNSSLVIPYDEVSSGSYSCQALRDGVMVEQHVVLVTIVDIPPLPDFPDEVKDTRKREGETAHLHYEFILPPSTSLSVQWKRTYAASNTRSNTSVDFGSRFSSSVSGTTLRFEITNLAAADAGTYVVNVSNHHGYSELHAQIYVEELDRTVVTLEFDSISCDLIEVRPEINKITLFIHVYSIDAQG